MPLQELPRKSDEEIMLTMMILLNLTFDLSIYLTMHELGLFFIKT